MNFWVVLSIKRYSKNNNVSQLSFFTQIIRFASFIRTEHVDEVIVNIIRESIEQDGAFLKLIQFSIQKQNERYVVTKYLEYYISFKEAAQKLEKIKQSKSELSKSYDTDFYIKVLSESIAG